MIAEKSCWKPLEISLLRPVVRGGVSQQTLSVEMICHGRHREVIEACGDDNEAIYRQLACAGTGLSEDELKTLVMPDYNSLLQAVERAYGDSSDVWFETLGKTVEDSAEQLPLLFPINSLSGELQQLTLTFPSVATVELMSQQPAEQQDMFIKSSCTGLGIEELKQLSVPDWKALDDRVADFLSQTGSFFLAKTRSSD